MTGTQAPRETVQPSAAPQPPGTPAPRPSPSRLARLAAILFFDGFRAAPGWMALVSTMLVLGSVAGTCYPLGYRLLLDGTLAGSATQTAEGIVVVAVLLGLGWVLTGIGSAEGTALADRIAVYRDDAISLGTVLMTVSLIRRSRGQLASAAGKTRPLSG